MNRLFAFVCVLLPFVGFAQLQVNTTEYDFGEVHRDSKQYFDFTLQNTTGKKVYILRADAGKSLDVRSENRTLEPDSLGKVRVQLNIGKKGFFKEDIALFVSSSQEPLLLTVSGKLMYTPSGEFTACPDFDATDEYERLGFEQEVQVLDSMTGIPIEDARIAVVMKGQVVTRESTGQRGFADFYMQTGSAYFEIQADGYQQKGIGQHFNKSTRKLKVYLLPDKEPVLLAEIPAPDEIIEVEEVPVFTEEVVEVEEILIEIDGEDAPLEVDEMVYTEASTSTRPGELDRDKYAPNNVVFLIDVSGSMQKLGRLELLKASMLSLLDQLRDIDYITVVTYSSGADVAVTTTSAANKTEITELIQNLEAKGGTQGGKGLRLAYRMARQSFIEGGNNQVILATDGAFSDADTDFASIARQNARKGVTLTVLGVVDKGSAHLGMARMAKYGKGNFIQITNLADAKEVLRDEIRRNSEIRD